MSGEEREDNIMAKEKVTTTLKMDKECAAVIRFRSLDPRMDAVTTSMYLSKEAYQKIGAKDEIVVEVRAK